MPIDDMEIQWRISLLCDEETEEEEHAAYERSVRLGVG
jgi:hypothetical protein